MMVASFRPLRQLPFRRRFTCSHHDSLTHYKRSFAERMSMAGIKPNHKIAIGVSGGPDSMALCVLTAGWKVDGLGLPFRKGAEGCIDGLVGIVVDHKLRIESGDEAELVRDRVSKLGIKCVVLCCDWTKGKPKLGHIQEAARDMRYQIFQNVCIEQQIGVLLIAHHADDQAELLLLRLSRNSGVLGLAGMAFMSQLFPSHSNYCSEGDESILLVRPLLNFTKEDLYKICEVVNQEYVEDPSNQRPLFTRNRLRMALKNVSSNVFRSEIQSFIAACRLTRSYIQNACDKMIELCVTITDHGYAIIDLIKLEPSNMEDLCLLKFLAIILQFISQKHRPIRGRVSHLLLDYVRTLPCKTSLTAAGCYLSPAPQSKGTKIIISCHDSQESSLFTSSHKDPFNNRSFLLADEVNQIILDAKLHSDKYITEACDIHFLHAKPSENILLKAREINLISESTFSSVHLLQMEENRKFTSQSDSTSNTNNEFKHRNHDCSPQIIMHQGESCHFMNRFLVTWEVCKTVQRNGFSVGRNNHTCLFCLREQVKSVTVRSMVEADWLYLAETVRKYSVEGHSDKSLANCEQNIRNHSCSSYMLLSAKEALKAIKSFPVSARRSLPVIVNSTDTVLNIPSISYSCCPYLSVSAVFKPRVPLGGGYSSYI